MAGVLSLRMHSTSVRNALRQNSINKASIIYLK